ncbi:MAG: 5-deoxy-glucuronate isomerase [Myxococcota bacterium]
MERVLRGPGPVGQSWSILPEPDPESGLALALLRLPEGGRWSEQDPEHETALLLLQGQATVTIEGRARRAERAELFRTLGTAWSLPAGVLVEIQAETAVEFVRVRTRNPRAFEPLQVGPESTFVDRRGEGQLQDAAFRFVRTYVDDRNGRPEGRLVLGEVVAPQGRWSSYPPHHHAQPEVYHYRFSPAAGFGHAEHGEEVFKVRHEDTLRIAPGHVHAQCAAPGYAMYYLWTIRHLEEARYDQPSFDSEHDWIRGLPKEQS